MVTITKHAEHDFEVACEGADGCGAVWDGLYSEMTAEDVKRTHHHGPKRTARIRRAGSSYFHGGKIVLDRPLVEYV